MNGKATASSSFATDIEPLFTPAQKRCMAAQGVELGHFDYMGDGSGDEAYVDHANARHVYARLKGTDEGRQMPLGGPFWTPEQLAIFQDWMDGGFLA
jgi:hypothetical protein